MTAIPSPVRAVLFDLDGTLVDALPDLADATRAMLADLGEASRSDAEISRYIGKGLGVLVERALTFGRPAVSAERMAEAFALFSQHYAAMNGNRSGAYPDAASCLAALRAGGLGLALVTNKAEAFTRPLLAQLGLLEYFDCIVCGDTLAQKKPAPEPLWHACQQLGASPAEAVMVGDSGNDVDAAAAAGVAMVMATYGYCEEVIEAGQSAPVDRPQAAALVSGLAQLPALLLRGEYPVLV